MATVKIETYLNEDKLTKIVSAVFDKINSFAYDFSDIDDMDEMIFDVRVCVNFEVSGDSLSFAKERVSKGNRTIYMEILPEILNEDYDILESDSDVLKSRLRAILKEFNQRRREALKYAS